MVSTHKLGAFRHRYLRLLVLPLIAVVVLSLLTGTAVYAQDVPSAGSVAPAPVDPSPLDKLCVSGSVINHAEEPLEGWTVTATYEGVNGSYPAMTATSDENGEFSFDLPGAGRWGLEIESRDGWEGVTATKLAVHVGYGNLDCVDVRFKVRELVLVVILKIDDAHVPQADWIMTATPGEGNTFAAVESQVTDSTGIAEMYLTPGTWIISEAPPSLVGWWRPISPVSGVQVIEVVGPGPISIRFKNQIEPVPDTCINVTKFDVPPDPQAQSVGLPGWVIQVVRADGSIRAEGVTDAFGQVSFTDLEYGPYTVHEIMQPGWTADSPSSYAVVLTSQDEGCTEIVFYNKQVPNGFCITGQKLDENGGVGIPDWQITATPVEPTDYQPDPVLTDGEGRYLICMPLEDYRVPGSVYTVSEVIPDGWTAVSPTAYLVTLPDYPGLPVEVPAFVNQQTQYAGGTNMMYTVAAAKPDPHGCSAWYVVRPGDSVSKVAAKYGVSTQAVFSYNPWVYRQPHQWLYVGQKLCIP